MVLMVVLSGQLSWQPCIIGGVLKFDLIQHKSWSLLSLYNRFSANNVQSVLLGFLYSRGSGLRSPKWKKIDIVVIQERGSPEYAFLWRWNHSFRADGNV